MFNVVPGTPGRVVLLAVVTSVVDVPDGWLKADLLLGLAGLILWDRI